VAYYNPFPNVDTPTALAIIAQNESGTSNIYSGISVPGYSQAQGGSGYFQMIPSTWAASLGLAGISGPSTAIEADLPTQTAAAAALYNSQGFSPWAGQAGSASNPQNSGTYADMAAANAGNVPGYVYNSPVYNAASAVVAPASGTAGAGGVGSTGSTGVGGTGSTGVGGTGSAIPPGAVTGGTGTAGTGSSLLGGLLGGSTGGITDWLAASLARIALVILGIGLVIVGTTMFGKGQSATQVVRGYAKTASKAVVA
jgi:hypothetical protein